MKRKGVSIKEPHRGGTPFGSIPCVSSCITSRTEAVRRSGESISRICFFGPTRKPDEDRASKLPTQRCGHEDMSVLDSVPVGLLISSLDLLLHSCAMFGTNNKS